MNSCGNIFLVGMMGAGKTTVGRHLARKLGRSFLDLDQEVERRTGVRIPVIFEIEGEQGFRRRESKLLREIAAEEELVVATGGGAVLSAENRACLARAGTVIYLCAPADILYERVRHDKNRPLLQVGDPRARIEEVLGERDPLYREIADITIMVGRAAPLAVVRQIERELRQRCAA